MEMQNERQLPLSQEAVWKALNDPNVLRACIPGCESMEAVDDNRYEAVVLAKVGPVKARFRGHVDIADAVAPESYTLRFEGQGGAAGFAKGEAQVRLHGMDDGGCRLSYEAKATVGGKLAQVGSRLVNGAARKMADQFFDNLVDHLDGGNAASRATHQEDEARSE